MRTSLSLFLYIYIYILTRTHTHTSVPTYSTYLSSLPEQVAPRGRRRRLGRCRQAAREKRVGPGLPYCIML